jgi:CHAT domain-containing protein/tetratricopeptide (TPR) repeat protein
MKKSRQYENGSKYAIGFLYIIKFLLLCGIMIAPLFMPSNGQLNSTISNATAWYKRAEYLYNLDELSEATDNEALGLYISVATLPQHPSTDRMRIESMIKAGNLHQGNGRLVEANEFYHWAIRENSLLKKWPEFDYEAYLYLGSSMYFKNIMDSAKLYFEKTAEISLAYRNKISLPEQDRLYNSLGAIYFESADYWQAISFFETALELASPRREDYNYYYKSIKSNIASCLIKLNKFDSAIKLFDSIEGKIDRNNYVFQPLAIAHFEKGEYQKSLEIFNRISLNSYQQKRSALNFIGRIQIHLGNWEKANIIFDSALTLQKMQKFRVKNKEDAFTYLYLSELSKKLEKIEDAFAWSNKALEEVHLNFVSASKFDLPKDVENTVSPIAFYHILISKAELIYELYKKEQKKETLVAALNTYIKAFQTVNYIARNFDNDDAKVFLIGTTKVNFEKAIEIAYQAATIDRSQCEALLYVLESYKGTVLRQNLAYSNLKRNSGIPKELIKRESELKQLYAAYLTKINLANTEEESRNLQKRLTELRVELSTLQNSFKKYEGYARIYESDQMDIPLKEIQKALDKETVLLNFFIGEENIYVLAVSRNILKIHKSPTSPAYEKALKDFMSASLNLTEGSRYKGYEAGNVVFKTLIEPIYSSVKHHKKMIIIPDDYLFYLPFDALDRTAGNKEYLVKSHAITSHYSVSLLMQHNAFTPRSNHPDSATAFAPFVSQNARIAWTGLEALPFSADEINNPRTLAFKGNQATKEQFMKSYNRHHILHLATHASLGEDSSANWIQLYPGLDSITSGRLFVHEIYNLNLSHNSLVILSACESGAGLSAKGEGLLSLSRAFMYAGSKGIISTLYRTDDRVTAFLMKQLYGYLEKGIEPAIALQKSKIDLLNSEEMNARFKSPNYWGNFIYIGKVSTHYENKSYWWILIPVMLMILASMVWLKYSTRNKF